MMMYGVIVAALVACAIASAFQAVAVVADVRMQNRAAAAVRDGNALTSGLERAETSQRGFLLTGDQAYLDPFENGKRQALASLQSLTTSLQRPQQRTALSQIEADLKDKLGELDLTITLERQGDHPGAMRVVRTNSGKAAMDRIRLRIAGITAECENKRIAALQDETFRVKLTSYAFVGLLLSVAALLAFATTMQMKAFAGLLRGNARISRAAYRDSLTGLPNRRDFERKLNELERWGKYAKSPVTALFIDLNGFKSVNDTLGHATGDTLLRQISGALRQVTRSGDTLARVGGDEFVVIAPGLGKREQIDQLCERLLSAVRPIELEFASIGLSIGVATRKAPDETLERLVQRADIAMYEAKRSGGGYRFSQEDEGTAFA
ncbi:diguanylate cyclase domain-containing protein [Caballeronia sp. LZ016]|uniref:diguanylate cyclase domain-containing protein n=1 Tax=Caballeronia sp. LZ016 TaxID=3038554 RepID=UPI00285E013E|nr:diguanylate cyclase [Caballeronia sp. LZ016]MDR5739997.1 diguanylate cyclase [Caballeronia sp. LZ016]